MYEIDELHINMNGYFKGEIIIDTVFYEDKFPFNGRYEFFQDEIYITKLDIVNEDSELIDIPQGFKTELKEEIKKYHGK